MRSKYSELFRFFGCYFHQDWMCESSTPDGMIKLFVSDSTLQVIDSVRKEIMELLARNLSEEELRSFIMDEMPCNYCYWMEWENGAVWLSHILEVFDSGNVNVDEF